MLAKWKFFNLYTINIPHAVYDELTELQNQGEDISMLRKFDWIKIIPPNDSNLLQSLLKRVHAGEAEAITLAVELKADLLLIDRKGTYSAKEFNLKTIGVLGILLVAKYKNIISEIKPL